MKRVECFIVGQGLAGTMLAFEMLEYQIDFRIVTSPIKSKASLVAAGMINPLVFKRLTKSWMVDDLLPVAKEKYRHLENVLGDSFYFEKEILKPLSEQEIQLWQDRRNNPEFSKYIKSVDEQYEFENLFPAAAYGIVRGGGYVDLSTFLRVSERFFRERNLIIDATLSFDTFNPHNNKFDFEKVEASKIVFCEGYHLAKNPLFNFIKLNPVKGEVLTIHAPELSEEYILNKKVFVLPVGNQRFKVGSTYEWKELNEIPTENGKRPIIERLENLITVPYQIENHWAGVRPAVIDRRPVLGIHPEFKNISVFNGLGTKGVMLAPLFANKMLEIITNENCTVNAEIGIERFFQTN